MKLRGFRIELDEVVFALEEHPAVREAAVALHGGGGEKTLVAYVAADGELAAESLLLSLKERLPAYMLPGAVVFLDALPRLPSGKVDGARLPAPGRAAAAGGSFVAPRDRVELELALLFQELLGTGPVGVRNSFFELGGHSLLAVRLVARIERRLGVSVPLAALFQRPTIESLAGLVQGGEVARSQPLLVSLRPAGTKPPIVWVHAVGGSALSYLDLCRLLEDRPGHAFQAPGLDGREPPLASIEEMADVYLAELLAARPEGPYLLGGWSMGGVVAFEMAGRLLRQGREVGAVVLLDSHAPPAQPETLDDLSLLAQFAVELGLPPESLVSAQRQAEPSSDDRLAALLRQAKQLSLLPPDLEVERVRRLFAVFKANSLAAARWRPSPYPGAVLLVRAGAARSARRRGRAQALTGLRGAGRLALSHTATRSRRLCA